MFIPSHTVTITHTKKESVHYQLYTGKLANSQGSIDSGLTLFNLIGFGSVLTVVSSAHSAQRSFCGI